MKTTAPTATPQFSAPTTPEPPSASKHRGVEPSVVVFLLVCALGITPAIFQDGGPFNWSWLLPLLSFCGALTLRFALNKIYPPIAACHCSATERERKRIAARAAISSGITLVALFQALSVVVIVTVQRPTVRGPIETAWSDIRRADRDRNTVCQVLEIDRTRHPFVLTQQQLAKLSSWVDSVATPETRGHAIVRTEPVLVRRWPRTLSASTGSLAVLELYHPNSSDLDGVGVVESMVIAEHACSPALAGIGS